MSYWLLKSEPGVFGIESLRKSRAGRTSWDGVRNYQARNFLRAMRPGDRAFFYHSNCPEPGIVGIVRVVREAYPDPTAFDPRHEHFDAKSDRKEPTWFMVDIELEREYARTITLAELRAHAARGLNGLLLLRRGNRLSVMPVSDEHWKFIASLE